ncbi:MAG: hypothetical protein AAGG68_17960 [Bacteroidota bacterium]
MNQPNLYTIFINVLSNRLFLNIVFWLIYAVFPLWLNWDTFASEGDRNTDAFWYAQAAVLVYGNNLILMPLFFDKRKYLSYFLIAIIWVCSIEYISMFIVTPLISSYLDAVGNKFLSYIYDLGDSFFFVLTFAGGRLIRQYILRQKNLEQLQRKQTETELAFLKFQVNQRHPHWSDLSRKVPSVD